VILRSALPAHRLNRYTVWRRNTDVQEETAVQETELGPPRNETLTSIATRHSIRMFTDQDVPDAYLRAILEAANAAPSAHNQQSWRFTILRGEQRKDLANLVTAQAADFPRPASVLLRMAARSIVGAPVVIAIVNTGSLIEHGTELFEIGKEQAYDFFRTMEIQSSAAAVENLLLAATSLGLGAVWLGILFLIKNQIRALLGEPEGEFMAVIPVGYAAKPAVGPKKQSLDEVVRFLL
jgi:nitroreductase